MNRTAALLDDLLRHEPADALEASHHAAAIELLRTASDPFTRAHFAPGHVTASLFIVDPSTGRLLLHHHRRLGRWLQMGGHLEGTESPVEAALREGAEESGLRDLRLATGSIADVDVHAIPAGKGEPDHRHYDVRFIAATAIPERIAMDAAESHDLAWFTLEDAEPLMNEAASSRVIRKLEALMRRGTV